MYPFCKDVLPCFIRIFHKRDKIDVVHKRKAHHGDDLGESTIPFDAPREDGDEQIGNQYHPSLYLYGVNTIPIEEM